MIWCDLDHTLIYLHAPLVPTPLVSALVGRPMDLEPPVGPRWRKFQRIEIEGIGEGNACCRKSARQFLHTLRRIDEVRMLTWAKRDYAVAMNDAFRFGFGPEQVVAREDMRALSVDRRGVLIDDAWGDPVRKHWAREDKKKYLGISEKRVIEVSQFWGTADDSFEEEWPAVVKRVRVLLRKR